jgi:hypothetical protein
MGGNLLRPLGNINFVSVGFLEGDDPGPPPHVVNREWQEKNGREGAKHTVFRILVIASG